MSVSVTCNGVEYSVDIGDKFNHLTITDIYKDFDGKYRRWFCDCVCDCEGKMFKDKAGVVKYVTLRRVVSGNDVSCGCINKLNKIIRNTKHNLSKAGKLTDKVNDSIYSAWLEMHRRIYGKDNKRDLTYAIKNITCCPEWDDYTVFLEWALENGFEMGLTLDRIDNFGNYSPDNCRWVTRPENCSNHTGRVYVEYHGKLYVGSSLFKELDVDKETIRKRCVHVKDNIYRYVEQ